MLRFRKSEIRLFKVAYFFLRTKLFCFSRYLESWNFQHLIDLGFHESSQNFNSFGPFLFFSVTNRDVLLLATIQYFKCNFMWNLVPLWKSYRWTGQTQKSTWQIYYKSVVAAANDKKTSWEPVKHYDFLPLLLKQELWISWTCAILSYKKNFSIT